MKHFTRVQNLGVTGHAQIAFVDVAVDRDNGLFLDSDRIEADPSPIGRQAAYSVQTFFGAVFDACARKDRKAVWELLAFGGERNETHLGFSKGNSRGKGSSQMLLYRVFEQLIDNGCFEDGLIQQPSDVALWTDNFGRDRMSDLLTNVIHYELAQFTWEQYKQWGLKASAQIYPMVRWDGAKKRWGLTQVRPIFLADEYPVLLTPKNFVCVQPLATPEEYLRKYVLRYRQQRHLDVQSELCRTRVDRQGNVVFLKPSQKDVLRKELGARTRKEYMREHTVENKVLLTEFHDKNSFSARYGRHGLSDRELDWLVYGRKDMAA